MTRVLFLGDLANTGFGTVTMDLGRALLALDLDVRFVSLNEEPGSTLPEPFGSRTAVLGEPGGWLDAVNPLTQSRLEGMFTGSLFEDGWTPEIAIVTGDMGSLEMSPILQFLPEGFPLLHYVPIEGIDLPPLWGSIWRHIQPVAMCNFGADEIAKVTGSRPPVVYHGVDTKVFHPVDPGNMIRIPESGNVLRTREDCRRMFGFDDDDILLLRTDRNMPRKNYASLFRALAPVLASNPRIKLVVHAKIIDQGGNLTHTISKLGKSVPQVILTDAGGEWGRNALAALYNAADIYVSNSAEGFGLTIAEAVACGLPAVGMAFSSVPEVIGPAGVTVAPGALIDNIYSYFWARVNEPAFGKAVDELVRDKGKRRLIGATGPRHVASNFSWTTAAAQFATIIAAALPQKELVAA